MNGRKYSYLKPSMMSRRAFTLTELLVVIAIIVIASLISIPALATLLTNNNLVQAENQISATLAQARSLALEDHTAVAVIFFEEPGNDSQTAIAVETEAPGQPAGLSSTLSFEADSSIPVSYLPNGIFVATVIGGSTDDGFAMPPGSTMAVNSPLRAIVFDGSGHVEILNSMVTAAPEALPGNSHYWDSTHAYGPSSPGLTIFEPGGWPASATANASAEAAYMTTQSNIFVVSTYTGELLK
ncbi:MAG: pilus assembly FimT family protein [Phycisphaerae bacterium]